MAFLNCVTCVKAGPEEEEEIRELDLSHHCLEDVPPMVFALERTLEDLNLEANNISTLPVSLFHCHGLRSLSLSDNELQWIPEALSHLSQLSELNLSKNALSDIPDAIKMCKNLVSLDLSVNPLQKIPEGATQLLNLSELFLNDTFLEFLPANFGRLAKLTILELRENSLNTLPKSLVRLASLKRLDLGQNDISHVPEVIGSLRNLRELWIDGNRLREIPSFIGNLSELIHLDVSNNRIESISESIGHCTKLIDLSASTNELKALGDSISHCEELITLKVDENALQELPPNIGRLKLLEELFCNQNYLRVIPPSIGLCRRLHTLNADDNDLEYLPKEIGSCLGLRILSLHGNHLSSLPAELGHISNLSVLNITANAIRHLPVSFMKLSKINALWISENQNKPLVQLLQDSDPLTGRRVLTNFLLPQVSPSEKLHQEEEDLNSENGSFHASIWEEERMRKSTVKWASGEVERDVPGNFRREPTPFPKEMRAMAKRVQNLRSKYLLRDSKKNSTSKQKSSSPEDTSPDDNNSEIRRILVEPEGGRDSGIVSEEVSPDSEEHSGRKPSDPLPLAPTEDVRWNKRPPPYHIAAALSKHASNFRQDETQVDETQSSSYHYENHSVIKRLERSNNNNNNAHHHTNKNAAPSNVILNHHNVSILSDDSELSSPSSLQTVLKRPSNEELHSDVESVRSHANKLRQVSEQLLLLRNTAGGSSNASSLRSSFARMQGKLSRPVSSAGGLPHNVLGLPPEVTPLALHPTPPLPQPQQNGLLSTIEQVSQASDDEDEEEALGFTQGILRPPGTMMPSHFRQHNYENVGIKAAAPSNHLPNKQPENHHPSRCSSRRRTLEK